MELISLFFYSFMVAFSGAAMPGSLLVLVITQCTRKGFWASPLIIIGHSILEIAIVIGLVFGLHMFLGNLIVQSVIGIAGGGFLIWMGVGMIKSIPKLTLNFDVKPQNSIIENPILGGILISLSNPYWTLWWTTIGLALITGAKKAGGAGIGVFYVGHILGDFIWYGFIALMLTAGRHFINDRAYRIIIAICAAFVLFLGGRFFLQGLLMLKQNF
jgi:threonine/homoserine/homoserine lactone efflux protein